jgi:hypothetical protein
VRDHRERFSIENFSRMVYVVEANDKKIKEIEEERGREQKEYEKKIRKMEEMIAKQDMVIGKMSE